MAPLRATVISHAPGRFGTPSRGQRRSAWVKASWAHSSARSQSPVWWIRAAVMRPHSWRKASATTVPTTLVAVTVAAGASPAPPAGSGGWPPGPASPPRAARMASPPRCRGGPSGAWRADLDGFVEVGALKHVEAGDLLFRLGERAVCHDGAGLPHPDRAGSCRAAPVRCRTGGCPGRPSRLPRDRPARCGRTPGGRPPGRCRRASGTWILPSPGSGRCTAGALPARARTSTAPIQEWGCLPAHRTASSRLAHSITS